jgi:hypothetical protein
MPFQNPLTPARLAAAIAATTLTVTGSVTTTPPTTPTPGTDEDTVRVMDQPTINALSASDKSTNFVIYNTTTSALNYCVNGNIVVPSSGAPQAGNVNLTGSQISTTFVTKTVTLAPNLRLITATLADVSNTGLHMVFKPGSPPQMLGWQANNGPLYSYLFPPATTSTATAAIITLRADNQGTQQMTMRNFAYDATSGNLTWEWGSTANTTVTQASLNWVGL